MIWGVVGGVLVAFGLVACGGGDEARPSNTSTPSSGKTTAATVPNYRLIKIENGHIEIQVSSANGLREIFDHVRTQVTAEGGYWVSIDCSTGGAAKATNRLATGRFALGSLGQARTGLEPGKTSFEVNQGARCPA